MSGMDQNSGGTSDKRNWRERLGIGTKDMPKIADEFQTPDKGAAKSAQAPVKAAPMAPRAAAKPAAAAPRPAAPAAVRPAPIAPDALANKLKTQRDAAEKLALQRVQAAKHKAEAAFNTAQPAAAKPKFSFADEDARLSGSVPAASIAPPQPIQTQPARPAGPPQTAYVSPQQQPFPGQLQPPRPQLGVNPGYAMPPNYAQPGYAAGGYQPQYQAPPFAQQPPAYRPIDPATGYAPPPGYAPTPRAPLSQQSMSAGPRLTMPPRASAQPQTRLNNPPRPPQVHSSAEMADDDVFEPTPLRPSRRATANEYQQAYREEMAYEEEAPRGGIWKFMLLGLLALSVALGAAYGYSRWVKPQFVTNGTGGNVPVVEAPQTAPKVVPEKPVTGQAEVSANKKLIYDRIEGDHEVLGGQVKSTEEAPIQPAGSGANAQPDTGTQVNPAANGNTGDSVPLPLPPPPGDASGQQGQLAPPEKTDVANINPAAEVNSAADLSKTPDPAAMAQQAGTAATETAVAPAANAPSQVVDSGIAEVDPPTPPAVPKKERVVAPKPPKKVVVAEKPVQQLGSQPVVLVPPKKTGSKSAANTVVITGSTPAQEGNQVAADNSLYGDAPVEAPAPVQASPTKTKTIFDLFKSTSATPAPPPATQVAATQPVDISNPAPAAPRATVVQLASFKSKAEASAEYRRLGQKHGAIITRFAPIIEQAQVAGSTRYRLNLGPMASRNAASSVCSSLIAAGERDCIVRGQ